VIIVVIPLRSMFHRLTALPLVLGHLVLHLVSLVATVALILLVAIALVVAATIPVLLQIVEADSVVVILVVEALRAVGTLVPAPLILALQAAVILVEALRAIGDGYDSRHSSSNSRLLCESLA
jgi:hypothetical protein